MASGFSELAKEIGKNVKSLQSVIAIAGVQELKRNFDKKKDPDTGEPWAKLSDITLARRRGKTAKILIDTGALRRSIGYKFSPGGVIFGLPESYKYGETHQFGASKGQYGVMSNGQPIPWGDIPARPFMGFDAEARKIISGQANKSLKEIIAKVPTKKTKI